MGEQTTEVSSIITLRFPKDETAERDRDVPLKEHELPEYVWLETNDHIAGIFKRRGQSKTYELVERVSREEARERGIDCY